MVQSEDIKCAYQQSLHMMLFDPWYAFVSYNKWTTDPATIGSNVNTTLIIFLQQSDATQIAGELFIIMLVTLIKIGNDYSAIMVTATDPT